METNEKQISNNIKAILKRYDISREELAKRLGITKRTLIKVVNHPNKYSINYLNEVASVIGCNVNDFFMPL
jgi:transcriptional regulator with XRE-family HTH domain